MSEIVKRPRARQDLKAIWRYSFEQWGEKQADKRIPGTDHGFGGTGGTPSFELE